MVSTFTTNKSFEKPARGDLPGTWDTPVNGNMNLADSALGGLATIALLNSPVTLSSAQYANVFLRLTGAITANVPITLPAVGSFYTVINDTTNSSAFYVTMLTTAAGGQTIGIPPGTTTGIFTDGVNARFRNMPHLGSYWDYAGSSMPSWITACTVWPYLNCDGTSFSSAVYPALAAILGGTTLPDAKGRLRMALDQGAGRVSSGVSGIAGNTLFAAGGDQNTQAHNHNLTVTDPGHTHTTATNGFSAQNQTAAGGNPPGGFAATITINSAVTGVTVASSAYGSGAAQNMPPVYVGGLTLIRAG